MANNDKIPNVLSTTTLITMRAKIIPLRRKLQTRIPSGSLEGALNAPSCVIFQAKVLKRYIIDRYVIFVSINVYGIAALKRNSIVEIRTRLAGAGLTGRS